MERELGRADSGGILSSASSRDRKWGSVHVGTGHDRGSGDEHSLVESFSSSEGK